MWPGPYGDGGSRKYLIASCDQSLKRLGVDYVDIFYHHRPDPQTPIEETMGALATPRRAGQGALRRRVELQRRAVRRGATAAAGRRRRRSRSTSPTTTCSAAASRATCCRIPREHGTGVIAFCPLASGLLTDKFLDGDVPPARAARCGRAHGCAPTRRSSARRSSRGLDEHRAARGQTLAQMALAWILRSPAVTSVAVGASRVEQIEANVKAIERLEFSADELAAIDQLTLEPPKAA